MTSLPPPLSERDASVVRLVGRFRQLTSRHVRCVLFADVTEMLVNRSLRRLVAMGYLTRLPRVFGDTFQPSYRLTGHHQPPKKNSFFDLHT